MATNSFKVKKSLNLDPQASPSLSDKGDLAVDSGTGTLLYNNGSISDVIPTRSSTDTLQNKSLDNTNSIVVKDTNLTIQDDGDTTKQVKFQASGISTSTTRTLTVPDANTTIVGTDATQTLTNKTLTGNTAANLVSGSGTLTLNTSGTITVPNATDTLVGKATTDTLTNKTLTAPVISTIVNTGTLTLPTSTDTLVGRATTDTLSNKTLDNSNTITVKDANFTIQDDADTTKIAKFQASTISSGVTRVLSLPNETTTLVGDNATQTLANKSIQDDLNFVQQSSTPSTPVAGKERLYAKTDGFFYSLDSNGTEKKIGSGSGSINYISNTDAESNTTGWATYADAAQNIPVDGTGGTATGLTFSRSTSSPLRGTGSFLIAQANSTSLQGKGVSYDFTIDSADKAKMLSISFDYNASSTFVASNGSTPLNDGTTSTNAGNSDIEVFIYDVTNSQLLYVSPQVLTGNGSNNFTYKGEFQTASNSTSYRLIFHCATTSANATGYSFKFDNVVVGPQTQLLGPPVTDEKSYVPTITGQGTPTNVKFYYSQLGDKLRVRGWFTSGTISGTTSFTLPSGAVIDFSKLSTQASAVQVGMWWTTTSSSQQATNNAGPIYSDGSTTGTVFVALNTATQQFTASNTGTSSGNVSVDFTVPIAGWSSTTTISNDTDTRVVAARITKSGNDVIATATDQQVILNVVTYDTHAGFNSGTSRYVAPISGKYIVTGSIRYSSNSTGVRYAVIKKNGSTTIRSTAQAVNGDESIVQVSGSVDLIAGDYLELWASHAAGTNLNIIGSNIDTILTVERISGPATIAASESVNMKAINSTTTVTSGSEQNLGGWATPEFDTHNAFVPSTGVYTVPISGKYSVASTINWDANFTGTRYCGVRKNGTVNIYGMQIPASVFNAGANPTITVYTTIKCVAGDTLSVLVFQDSGSTRTINTTTATHIEIQRIGN